MFTRFCESRRRFFSLLSLKYLYISFFRSLPAPCLLPCSPPPLSRRKAIRAPLSSLPASAPLVLRSCSCRVFRGCRAVCPLSIGHASKLSGGLPSCLLCLLSVTRQLSGAKQCDSVGRCSAYMSPALSPLAYVLPCVPLVVPWLPSVCPCVCPAGCRLVVIIAYTPLYPGRLRCGAASEV